MRDLTDQQINDIEQTAYLKGYAEAEKKYQPNGKTSPMIYVVMVAGFFCGVIYNRVF